MYYPEGAFWFRQKASSDSRKTGRGGASPSDSPRAKTGNFTHSFHHRLTAPHNYVRQVRA